MPDKNAVQPLRDGEKEAAVGDESFRITSGNWFALQIAEYYLIRPRKEIKDFFMRQGRRTVLP